MFAPRNHIPESGISFRQMVDSPIEAEAQSYKRITRKLPSFGRDA